MIDKIKSRSSKKFVGSLILLIPAFLILSLSLFWPIISILLRSFNPEGQSVLDLSLSFIHYINIFKDDLLRRVIGYSFSVALIATLICTILAFPAAYIISKLSRAASSTMMVLLLMPFWVSIVIRLFAFTIILGQNGIINNVLAVFGLEPYPLIYNTFANVVGMVAYLLPYLTLILISAMMSVDDSLMTAARTVGASERRIFFQVYLPQIRSTLIGGMVVVFVLALGFFLTPAILGGPRDLTIPIFIQQQIDSYQWGKASAMGIVLLVITVLGLLMALNLGGKGLLTPMKRGSRGVVSQESLKLTPMTLFCLLILIIDLIILIGPILIVIPTSINTTTLLQFPPKGFTWKWFIEVFSSNIWRESLWMSVKVGLGVAVVATVCGSAMARVGQNINNNYLKNLIQVIAIMPLVVPVILLAIGIFDVQNKLNIIGTDYGLIIGQAVLCLPLVFVTMAGGFSSIDKEIEEASWSIGAGKVLTLFKIIIPNVIPALIASLTISFVVSWDEAVIALFQTQVDKTLPVTIYSMLKSGITPAVSAASTLVILPVVIGAIGMVIYLIAFKRNT